MAIEHTAAALGHHAGAHAHGHPGQIPLVHLGADGQGIHVRDLGDRLAPEHARANGEFFPAPTGVVADQASAVGGDAQGRQRGLEGVDLVLGQGDFRIDQAQFLTPLFGGQNFALLGQLHQFHGFATFNHQLAVVDPAHQGFRLGGLAFGLVEIGAAFLGGQAFVAFALGQFQQQLLALGLLFRQGTALGQQLVLAVAAIEHHDHIARLHQGTIGYQLGDVEVPDVVDAGRTDLLAAAREHLAIQAQRLGAGKDGQQEQAQGQPFHGVVSAARVSARATSTRTLMPDSRRGLRLASSRVISISK